MKEYTSDTIRNVAFVGHGDCGKTTLVDAFLHTSGDISRIGSVEAGNTVSDFTDEEKERQITINTSLIFAEYNGMKLNVLDTPGFADFLAEVKGALKVVETAVVIMKADAGLEVGTEQVWRYAKESDVPRILLVNKLDKEHTDFDAIIQTTVDRFGTGVAPLQFPLNPGPGFTTIIDLLKNKALVFEQNGKGSFTETDIPDSATEKAASLRETLVEAAAEADDALMEKYFEDGDLSPDDILAGLLKGIREGTVHPLLCCSAQTNVGTGRVMELITQMVPAPGDMGDLVGTDLKGEEVSRARDDSEPFCGQVFKTLSEAHVGELSFMRVFGGTLAQGQDALNSTRSSKERIGSVSLMKGHNRVEVDKVHSGDLVALVKLKNTHTGDTLCAPAKPFICPPIPFPDPVIRVAIEPLGKGDETKLSIGLQRLCAEDPSVSVVADPELQQTLLFGQGEVQLEVVAKKLKARFGVEIEIHEPKVKYRETITKPADAHARHKKQTGGRGQFADVRIKLEPKPRGEGYEFVKKIVGGSIPNRFIPSVDKGITRTAARGALAGYLCVDFQVTLYDGTFHDVDSSDAAFQRAASMAFKQAWKDAGPILLEPIYNVEVTVPDDYTGDIMADISSRRGKVEGVTSEGPFQVIQARIPLAELFKYSTSLRSMTQGRATHHREFSHYDPMPHDVMLKVISQAELEEDEED